MEREARQETAVFFMAASQSPSAYPNVYLPRSASLRPSERHRRHLSAKKEL